MVRETNKYAEQLIKSREITQGSRMKPWKPVTLPEVKAHSLQNSSFIKK